MALGPRWVGRALTRSRYRRRVEWGAIAKREAIEAVRDADIAELVNASGGLSITDRQVLYFAHEVDAACIIIVWNFL